LPWQAFVVQGTLALQLARRLGLVEDGSDGIRLEEQLFDQAADSLLCSLRPAGTAFYVELYRTRFLKMAWRCSSVCLAAGRGRGLVAVHQNYAQAVSGHSGGSQRIYSDVRHQIQSWRRAYALARKLEHIAGIGPITASALVASIGDAKHFANGRQLAAWLGAGIIALGHRPA
jgi:Transposase IS116/IS110/IS902 family